METLNLVLPVLLYIAGIILLIVLIVLGIKLIKVLDRVDRVVENVEEKVNALNTTFDVIVNIDQDRMEILKLVSYTIKQKSLESLFPEIAKEWDYEKKYYFFDIIKEDKSLGKYKV